MLGSTFNIDHATSQIRLVTGIRYIWLGAKNFLVTQIVQVVAYPVLVLLGWVLWRRTNRLIAYFQAHISEKGVNLSFNEKVSLYRLLFDEKKSFISLKRVTPDRYPFGFRGMGRSIHQLSIVSSELVAVIAEDLGVDNYPESDVFTFSDPTTWGKRSEAYSYLC